jgi:hypothetical protein
VNNRNKLPECEICTSELDAPPTGGAPNRCPCCGDYILTGNALAQLRALEVVVGGKPKNHLYSGAIREIFELTGGPVTVHSWTDLLASVRVPKTPIDKLDRLLLFMSVRVDTAHDSVVVDDSLLPIVYTLSMPELEFIANSAEKLGYIERLGGRTFQERRWLRLTFRGWERAVELSKAKPVSRQAFVAMSFQTDLYSVWLEGIAPALEAVGYEPIRVDTRQTNDKIDDKIIADIRRSGLVVADFTGHRGGVYFEAGFALGLGTPVIFTCRADDLEKAHFDTRQYNHLVWQDAGGLKRQLIDRIEATLPNRPNGGR